MKTKGPSLLKASLSTEQEKELSLQRSLHFETGRATVPALEELLYKPFAVLDHGFVRVVDYMGDDNAVVQAARVSYGTGTKKVREDRGLIRYLIRHRHTTPFEMCEIKFHVKLPIFVARQWVRHRTANINEYSARYSFLDNEFYVPAPEKLATQSNVNRQGRGSVLEGEEAADVMRLLREDANGRSIGYTKEDALADATAGMRYIRKNASSLGVDPRKVGAMGFSAGGDLCIRTGLSTDPLVKPDFLCPVYPAVPVHVRPFFL